MIAIASTIKDIAALCGVSEGTVDRALNNRNGISEKTKDKILQVAKELDYQPNHLARSLATGSTYTIGVVCINLSNNFFSLLIESIEANAKEHGYFINLILTHNDPVREMNGIQYLARRKVDGLIIFPVGNGKEYEKELKKLNVPIVTVYNRISSEFIHVDVDCRQIMRNAVSYIIQKGYRRIIYLDDGIQQLRQQGINIFSFEERRHGYLEGIRNELLEEIILEDFDKDRIIHLAKNEENIKTAVLCPYDILAIRVLNLFKESGISVPNQVGIMGFDNIDMLKNISPRIQSVDCGVRELGKKAFSMLLRQINNDCNVGDCVIRYSFTEGETL